jgi:hypothetical protein
MPTIFIGLLGLALVLWLAKWFARVDPKYMIRVGRTAGGIVALAGAAFLGARGELAVRCRSASPGSACWAGRSGKAGEHAQTASKYSTPNF